MLDGVSWRSANSDDVAAFQEFTCAVPDQRGKIQKAERVRRNHIWEFQVQCLIRDTPLPKPDTDIILMGFDRGAFVATAWAEPVAPDDWFINWLAVGLSWRRRSGLMANELVDTLLDRIVERVDRAGARTFRVFGNIDPLNVASKDLCRRHGFSDSGSRVDGYEVWDLRGEIE